MEKKTCEFSAYPVRLGLSNSVQSSAQDNYQTVNNLEVHDDMMFNDDCMTLRLF